MKKHIDAIRGNFELSRDAEFECVGYQLVIEEKRMAHKFDYKAHANGNVLRFTVSVIEYNHIPNEEFIVAERVV